MPNEGNSTLPPPSECPTPVLSTKNIYSSTVVVHKYFLESHRALRVQHFTFAVVAIAAGADTGIHTPGYKTLAS